MSNYTITWQALDVQSLRPDWSLDECERFLSAYFDKISERMVETGWEILEYYSMGVDNVS